MLITAQCILHKADPDGCKEDVNIQMPSLHLAFTVALPAGYGIRLQECWPKFGSVLYAALLALGQQHSHVN
jgi:hypothetical protein